MQYIFIFGLGSTLKTQKSWMEDPENTKFQGRCQVFANSKLTKNLRLAGTNFTKKPKPGKNP